MLAQNKCKICRRLGQKNFLKGDKCFSPKCPMVKKPYPPGLKSKKGGRSFSEYAKQLKEKQKLKKYYGLSEKQMRSCIKDILQRRKQSEDATLRLLRKFEERMDNAVFRCGFAKSRKQARQLVNHGYFLINQKPCNIASAILKTGDEVAIKENKKSKTAVKTLILNLKNYQCPNWLDLNKEKLSFKMSKEPSQEEIGSEVDISSIFEFYSR